jgi:hypothetical protein
MSSPATRVDAPARPTAASKAPLEVAPPPVLAKIEGLLRQGRNEEAIRAAFQSAEDDVRRAFGLKLPKQWTHREFLEKYLRADMGNLVNLLPQLYRVYEPVRYGRSTTPSADGLMELLRSIYQEPSLRRLSWTIGADSSLTARTVGVRPPPTPRTGDSKG